MGVPHTCSRCFGIFRNRHTGRTAFFSAPRMLASWSSWNCFLCFFFFFLSKFLLQTTHLASIAPRFVQVKNRWHSTIRPSRLRSQKLASIEDPNDASRSSSSMIPHSSSALSSSSSPAHSSDAISMPFRTCILHRPLLFLRSCRRTANAAVLCSFPSYCTCVFPAILPRVCRSHVPACAWAHLALCTSNAPRALVLFVGSHTMSSSPELGGQHPHSSLASTRNRLTSVAPAVSAAESLLSTVSRTHGSSVLILRGSTGPVDSAAKNILREWHPCNCKKSKCIKLYCECFAAGRFCKGCNCEQCNNVASHQSARQKAIDGILQRKANIRGFQSGTVPSFATLSRKSKGCNCKKSGCKKKYCECFQRSVRCSDLCQCQLCENQPSSTRPGVDSSRSLNQSPAAVSSDASPTLSHSVTNRSVLTPPTHRTQSDHDSTPRKAATWSFPKHAPSTRRLFGARDGGTPAVSSHRHNSDRSTAEEGAAPIVTYSQSHAAQAAATVLSALATPPRGVKTRQHRLLGTRSVCSKRQRRSEPVVNGSLAGLASQNALFTPPGTPAPAQPKNYLFRRRKSNKRIFSQVTEGVVAPGDRVPDHLHSSGASAADMLLQAARALEGRYRAPADAAATPGTEGPTQRLLSLDDTPPPPNSNRFNQWPTAPGAVSPPVPGVSPNSTPNKRGRKAGLFANVASVST